MASCVGWLCSTLLLLHFCALFVFANDHSSAYCNYNRTFTVSVPVKKIRFVERQPTGFFKFTKKSKTVQEEYDDVEEQERTELVVACCEGYRITPTKFCLPHCQHGCPRHASCTQPNQCQCRHGYTLTAEHECAPHCSGGCQFGGKCMAPGMCECEVGYRSESGNCVPVCTVGEGCRNGHCDGVELCVCNEGYRKNAETGVCEPATACEDAGVSCGVTDTTDSSAVWEAQSTHSDWNADIYSGSGSDGDGDGGSGDGELFASECDCTMEFGICTQDGRCACAEGYVLQQPEAVGDIEAAPICAALLAASERASASPWLVGALICVGVLLVLMSVAVIVVKIWRQRRGSMDVAGKTELCCKYDKHGSSSIDIGRV